MKTVVLTGGLGFIFSQVTQYLVQRGYKVIVIDNESEGSHPEIQDGSFLSVLLDAGHERAARLIESVQPEYIIHAAAYSDVDLSIRLPQEIISQNCQATLNIFNAARKVKNLEKLVYISTDEVYGECDHPKTEDEVLFPRNPYSFSKAYGSMLRLAYDNTYPELKDKTAETRFCNVVGDRQDARKILPRIKESLKTGEPVPVHNGGGGYREYLWVESIPPAVELVMLKGNRTYNITNAEGFTVNELIERVEEVTGKKVPVTKGGRPGMDMKYQMDSTRIRDLGWSPTIAFDEGLRKYLC